MKTIKKKISLEPLITRFPLCYPSLVDGEITYYSGITFNNAFYGCIPLGVSSAVTGSFSGFTDEMGEAYNDCVLDCYTLQQWFNEFVDYYALLRSAECRGEEFNSASDYFNAMSGYQYNINVAIEMDENFKLHGGDKFYTWLTENYFITLDLIGAYSLYNDRITGCGYTEWIDFVDNIGITHMPFVQVLQFSGKMNKWYELYEGKECSEMETCCDCVDYYSFGGAIMTNFLNWWVGYEESVINNINNTIQNELEEERKILIPKSNINISLTTKFEDLGPYVDFCKEFKPGVTYFSGNVCSYDGDVYILSSDTYNELDFHEESGWARYYDYQNHSDYQYTATLSGRTMSNLETFIRKDLLNDTMCNKLPGYYGISDEQTQEKYPQPPENYRLDFMYKPGTYTNLNKYVYDEEIGATIYTCNYLEKIVFYGLDENGDIIQTSDENDTFITSKQTATDEDNVNDVIMSVIEAIEDINGRGIYDVESGFIPYENPIYAEFYTYQDIPVYFDENGNIIKVDKYGKYMSFVDKCKIYSSSCQFYLSKNDSYPLEYYNVDLDIESIYSNETKNYVDVYMCDFFFEISAFTRNYVEMPLIRKEELMPFSNIERPVDNIYINRGYATALDRHLRIGEINDCDELASYGNGIFKINDINE